MTRLRRVLLILLVLALLRLPLNWLKALLLPEPDAAPLMNHAVTMLQALLLFALPGWLLRPEQMRIPPKPAYPAGWGFWPVALAMLLRLTVAPLNRWWASLLNAPVSMMLVPQGGLDVIVWLLAAVVVPAVAEELFFRGALLGNLSGSSPRWQSVLLSTLAFALMHGNAAGLPGHLITGLVLSVLTLHSGRLAEPVAAHMMYNLLVLIRWEAAGVVPWVAAVLLCVAVCWMLKGGSRKTRRMRPALPEWLLCGAALLVMGAQYLI